MTTTTKRRLAVVILNWNGAKLLEQFLPSVLAHTPEELAEVVVADNGSADHSLQLLADRFPSVRIIPLSSNHGFAEGYNLALAEIENEYTVLLNSDVEVTPGWLDAPLAMLDSSPTVAGVQPKIRAWRNKDCFEYAGASGGFLDKYGYPFCRGRLLHVVEQDNGQYDTPTDLLWASGACLFIRTAVYKEVGGLDGRFFAHQEEIDMCWRLRSRGYRLVCTPQSVVYHVGGATLSAESPRKTHLNFRNSLLMLYKNSAERDLKWVLFVRFWLDYVAAAKFLLSGNPGNARAVYAARHEFKEWIPAYRTIRQENLAKTTVTNIPELMRRSLIAQFYLRGKVFYSELVGI